MREISKEKELQVAEMLYEAAILVEFANSGRKLFMPNLDMYKNCSIELAEIAIQIRRIRSKGYGANVEPNTYTK
jgi:hypothetical protein